MGCAPLAVPPALIKVGMRLRLTLLPVHFLSRLPRDPARFTPVALRFLRHRVLLLCGDCTRIAIVTPLPPGEGGREAPGEGHASASRVLGTPLIRRFAAPSPVGRRVMSYQPRTG